MLQLRARQIEYAIVQDAENFNQFVYGKKDDLPGNL